MKIHWHLQVASVYFFPVSKQPISDKGTRTRGLEHFSFPRALWDMAKPQRNYWRGIDIGSLSSGYTNGNCRRVLAAGIILCMPSTNERRRYIVTSSLIGWVNTQNHPCCSQCRTGPVLLKVIWERLSLWQHSFRMKAVLLLAQKFVPVCWWCTSRIGDWYIDFLRPIEGSIQYEDHL